METDCVRCKGCGILLVNNPEIFSLHLRESSSCRSEYPSSATWQGIKLISETVHVRERSHSSVGKWRIYALDEEGDEIFLCKKPTKDKASLWISSLVNKVPSPL